MHAVPLAYLSTALCAGAAVILTGALYAALFAWARVGDQRRLMTLAYLAFAGLVVAVGLLVWTLHMTGFWAAVAAVMLLGYLLAPRAIWRLTVGIEGNDNSLHHKGAEATAEKTATSTASVSPW